MGRTYSTTHPPRKCTTCICMENSSVVDQSSICAKFMNIFLQISKGCLEYLPDVSGGASNWKPDIRQLSRSVWCKFPHFIPNEFNGSLDMQTCQFTALFMEMVNYKFQSVSSMLSTLLLKLIISNCQNATIFWGQFLFQPSVNKALCVSLTRWRVAFLVLYSPDTTTTTYSPDTNDEKPS